MYRTKSVELSIKDVSRTNRQVKVVLSRIGAIDSARDVIMKGAFNKSLMERGVGSTTHRKIAALRHHDWQQQIGKFIELSEQGDELIAVTKLGTSTIGEDALKDYDEGIITQHSIGFKTIDDKASLKQDSGGLEYRELHEVDLWEGSAVTFGSNEHTPTLEVTKGNVASVLESLNKKSLALSNVLRNGSRTDEHFYMLEMQFKYITKQYNDIIKSFEPTNKSHSDKKEPIIVTPSNEFFKLIKL